MREFKRHLVTAALPYANGPVHIGHLAGVYIPADIYVRYLRKKGEDVVFVCGSDEHGVPITIKAKNEGLLPQDIVDRYHAVIKQSFADFGIRFDNYSRTSSAKHAEVSSGFFAKLYADGGFLEQTSEQYYDETAQQFLADRYITGICPKCQAPGAYGDQCEKCGSALSPNELIDPVSAITGNKPVMKETKHWYLPLDKHEAFLRQWILEGHKEWKPNVYGQCKSWLDQGLQPRAVSRDLDWGVPVPVDGAEGKVLYVWFDAPIGYITSTQELRDDWELYWKSEDTKLVHFIGKDNIVFHCIVFPAMLKAHGDYVLPENVPANEFLNLEGDKISTSKNWAVWLHEYLEEFPGQQDSLRYALCASAPEAKDNDFTWKDFQARNNNELVAILGNFVNRVTVLINKYYAGIVPAPGELAAEDTEALKSFAACKERISQQLNAFRFREALKEAMALARLGNKYLADQEPWKLVKTDAAKVQTIMYVSMQITANIAAAIEPFLPHTATKICQMLGQELISWERFGLEEIIAPGHLIGQPQLLFRKIEDSEIDAQVAKLLACKAAAAKAAEPAKENIGFDDFMKSEIITAEITAAEAVKGTKKLLKIELETGKGRRTVVSGIAEYYQPGQIIGQKVCLLANLEPRKIKGIESQGMILMAEDSTGKLHFVLSPTCNDKGSVIR
jgi:methionyl-tRNA synthetase